LFLCSISAEFTSTSGYTMAEEEVKEEA
jgi:hypothetical protein